MNFIIRSIRAKLIFWISLLFVFIAAFIYLPLSNILPKKITAQILKRDVEIAKYLSNEAKDLLLFDDKIALSLLLHENLDKLEDAQYLFIQGPEGNILSHTFTKGFPKGLLSFGPDTGRAHRIKEFSNEGRKIYDIKVPILDGQIGTMHLGVSMESGKKDIADITKINHYVGFIILIGLGTGVSIFLILGFLFSRQIIKLKNFTVKIGRGDLDAKVDINSKDEIGALASAFNEMALRLKGKIKEIKKLNIIEERNRIAIDLHDSCAQDLANIIKRLELCEKLFEINQEEALAELRTLRGNTKDVLRRTRRVIFNFKTSEDVEFNLLHKLNSYIKDYMKENDINVKLDITGEVDNIHPDKAKSIFFIMAEALTNVKKHSLAKDVNLSLKRDINKIIIEIKDNGRGFDVSRPKEAAINSESLGLIGMRQRAHSLGGTIAIESKLQQGARISIDIPMAEIAV